MGPFPFIRFDNIAQNAGFMPQSNVQSDLLNSFFGEYSDDDFVGSKYFPAILDYREKIATLNEPINGGNLVLINPKPFPQITGTQTLVFKVQNNELFATDSTQFVEITLNLTNGVITSNSYVFSGSISQSGTYDTPIVAIEKEIQQALDVYSKSGSAFFSPYYSFDRSTQLATSGLIRAKNWKLTDELVSRDPLPENPFRPNDWIYVSPFLPDDTFILTQFGKVVNFAFDSAETISTITAFVNSLSFPTGFSVDIDDNTTDLIEITISGSDSGFKLIGFFDSVWTWQRFYTDSTPVSVPFITVGSFAGQWPFEPNTGRFFQTSWYDIEDLSFVEEPDLLKEDEYAMPIKTGDQLQFNIIPELANLTGIDSCQIGLFDCDGNFLQKVGMAQFPACSANRVYKIYLAQAGLSAFESHYSTGFESLNIVDNSDALVAELPIAFLNFLTLSTVGNSFVNFCNGVLGNEFTITYEIVNPGAGNILIISFELISNVPFYPSISDQDDYMPMLPDGTLGYIWPTETEGTCLSATQLQGTVFVPSLANGAYYFGLYNSTGYVNEIYSFSNRLFLNNKEEFSQILEIGSAENELIEGFEYFNGWLQRIRVNLNGAGATYEIQESIYRNSNGTFQKPENSTDENISLQSDYLDLSTQRAMTSATRHPIFVLSGQNLSVQGDLEIATVQDYTTNTSFRRLQQMKLSAKIQGYQPSNNACLG